MKVRKFYLKNELGQEYSLMDFDNYCFFNGPEGLGISYSNDYEKVGYSYIPNSINLNQNQISGTAVFQSYDNYKKLVDFIAYSEEIRLFYVIPFEIGEREYIRDVDVEELSKSEILQNGLLEETLTLNCKSLWYTENTMSFTIGDEEDSLIWDFKWDSRFVNYSNRRFEFINTGHIPASIEVEIDGPVENPTITLEVEGTLAQQISVDTDIVEYEKFLYSSKDNDFYIKKQNTNGTYTSLFDLTTIDINNDNVIKIPINKSCSLALTGEQDILSAKIKVFMYYKAV